MIEGPQNSFVSKVITENQRQQSGPTQTQNLKCTPNTKFYFYWPGAVVAGATNEGPGSSWF